MNEKTRQAIYRERMKIMNNPLPVEYLHKIREENYETTKHLSPEEFLKKVNENGRRLHEKAMMMKHEKNGV